MLHPARAYLNRVYRQAAVAAPGSRAIPAASAAPTAVRCLDMVSGCGAIIVFSSAPYFTAPRCAPRRDSTRLRVRACSENPMFCLRLSSPSSPAPSLFNATFGADGTGPAFPRVHGLQHDLPASQ